MKLFTPNEHLSSRDRRLVNFGTLGFILLCWFLFNSTFLPSPTEVFKALLVLLNNGLIDNFLISIGLCLKCIGIATLVSMFIAYIATIPILKSFSYYVTKLRFLPVVGISFLFMKLSHDVAEQKVMLLTFGIATFLVDSIYSVVTSTTQDEINYARTLRLSQWQTLWEVIIVGKLAQVFECVRQNIAMAWMMLATVENLCKSQGGIGVVISDLNKWFKFEYVYAVQICILITGILLDTLINKAKYWFFPYLIKLK